MFEQVVCPVGGPVLAVSPAGGVCIIVVVIGGVIAGITRAEVRVGHWVVMLLERQKNNGCLFLFTGYKTCRRSSRYKRFCT